MEAIQAAPAAPLPVDPESCAVCRTHNFTENALADQQLAAAPIRRGFGQETVQVSGNQRLSCSSVLCRCKFHAKCIAGMGALPQDANPDTMVINVPKGWICFWCTATNIMPSMIVERHLHTTQLRGSACRGTLRFPRPTDADRSVMLLCTKGLENSHREVNNIWPSNPTGTLVINGLNVAMPRSEPIPVAPGVRGSSMPILNINSVLNEQNSVVVTLAENPPTQPRDESLYFVMAVLGNHVDSPVMRITDVVCRRALHPAFALQSRLVQNELSRRMGRFLGMADASLQGIKRSWRRLDIVKTAPIRVLSAVVPPADGNQVPLALPWSADDNLGDSAVMTQDAKGVPRVETSGIDNDFERGPMEVSFRDPITRTNIAIPVRGATCTHTSLFDLNTYLLTNNAAGAFWNCPHCATLVFPSELFFDSYIYGIMLCASRGQLAGSRVDAETSALFGGAPGGIVGAAGPTGLGPMKVPANGLKLDATIEGVTIEMDGSWTINVVDVQPELDAHEEAPAPPQPVAVEEPVPAEEPIEALEEAIVEDVPEMPPPGPPPNAGFKRVQPPRAAKTNKKRRDD